MKHSESSIQWIRGVFKQAIFTMPATIRSLEQLETPNIPRKISIGFSGEHQ